MKRIRFSNRRALLLLVGSAAVLLLVGALTPAVADPTGAGLGAFGLFDMADSHGLRSPRALGRHRRITDPLKMFLAQRLLTGWNVYRYSISLMAYLLDWTINMSWLGAITGPLEHISTLLKDKILTPPESLRSCSPSRRSSAVPMIFGRMAGLWDIVSACIIAALVTGALASPVAKYTGEPLTKARNVGVSLATMIVNNDDASMASPDQQPAQLQVGKILVDAMIRPAHGLVNYGVNFTGGQACTGAYDKALPRRPLLGPGRQHDPRSRRKLQQAARRVRRQRHLHRLRLTRRVPRQRRLDLCPDPRGLRAAVPRGDDAGLELAQARHHRRHRHRTRRHQRPNAAQRGPGLGLAGLRRLRHGCPGHDRGTDQGNVRQRSHRTGRAVHPGRPGDHQRLRDRRPDLGGAPARRLIVGGQDAHQAQAEQPQAHSRVEGRQLAEGTSRRPGVGLRRHGHRQLQRRNRGAPPERLAWA